MDAKPSSVVCYGTRPFLFIRLKRTVFFIRHSFYAPSYPFLQVLPTDMMPNRVHATPTPATTTTTIKAESAVLPAPLGHGAQASALPLASDSPAVKVKVEVEQSVGDGQGAVTATEVAASAAAAVAVAVADTDPAAATSPAAAALVAAPHGGSDMLQVSSATTGTNNQLHESSSSQAGTGGIAVNGSSSSKDGHDESKGTKPETEASAGYQPVVVNPGRLAKGVSGGTFAEIEVRGGRNRGDAATTGSAAAWTDRISVYIRKL